MSTRLVTQLSTESPRVLVLGKETSLTSKITSFLTRQGLEVDSLPSLSSNQDTSNVLSKNFYKIIVLGSSEETRKNMSFLKEKSVFQDSILVITLISTIEPNLDNFSHNNLIIGQDVIPEGEALWPFLAFVGKNIDKEVLTDPNIELFLQSEQNFFDTIKKLILSPKKQRTVIRGKKHSSAVIIREMIRLLSLFHPSSSFQIKREMKKALNKSFAGFEKIDKTEPLPSLLEESVRNIKVKKQGALTQEKKDFHKRTLQKPDLNKIEVQKEKINKDQEDKFNILNLTEEITTRPVNKPVINQEIDPTRETEKDKKSLDDQLNKIFEVKRVDQKVERVQKIVKETKKIKKKTKKKKILFVVGALFTVIASFLLVLTGIFFISTSSLEKELTNVFFKFSNDEATEVNYGKVNQISTFLDKQIFLYEQILPPEVFIDSRNLIEISQKITDYDQYKKEFSKDVEDLVSSFLGKDLLEDVVSSQKQAKTAQAYYETVSRLLSRLNDFKDAQKKEDKQVEITNFIDSVESQKDSLLIYQQLSPIFDSLFGENGKKTYAVIFQNNQELRPTGGFVQAVALLTVDQGMLVDSQVFSSYELDKNLGGAVVPPDDVINLLGENNWYLRDSNWDPDFVASSKQIKWFLEQETDKEIDGVIGINLFVLKNILKEFGPLELEEYNEIITDKNLFERSEFHSEVKLVKSNDVEDYQSNLLRYLLRDLVVKGQDNPKGLLSALTKSLDEKQMTISMTDEDFSKTLSLLGWSGELITPKCPNQLIAVPCQVDSLVINEANIGINKANYHTTREDSHIIELKEKLIKHTRRISLDNTAFINAWPKGVYKSYFRFYIPSKIDSLSIKVDGQTVNEDKYEIIKQKNNQLIKFLIETPIKTEKNIEISYVVPMEFSLPYSYVFFNQKQPGTNGVLPQIIIKYDSILSPTLIAPQAEVQGNSIVFDNLDEDHAFVGVSFK